MRSLAELLTQRVRGRHPEAAIGLDGFAVLTGPCTTMAGERADFTDHIHEKVEAAVVKAELGTKRDLPAVRRSSTI